MAERVTVAEATDAQKLAYLNALLDAEAGLRAGIRLLSGRQNLTGDPDESRLLEVQLLDLEADLAKVRARKLAMRARDTTFRPPTKQQAREIREAANELDGMIAAAVEASAILDVTTIIIEGIGRLA